MSKIIAIAILTAFTIFPYQSRPKSSSSNRSGKKMEVMVLFAGLMVFNKNPETGAYEVGILGPDHADGHEFCIQRLGAPRVCWKTAEEKEADKTKSVDQKKREETTWLPETDQWAFEITPDPPKGTLGTIGNKAKRRPDDPDHQYDLDWVIPLDGPGFHDKPLELRPGLLKPIIQLPKVNLFTKYKSPDFVRMIGGKAEKKPFGFVAETVGFRVQLKKGQILTLRDKVNGTIITEVKYFEPSDIGGNYEVIYISNTRYPQEEASDFNMYYQLFSDKGKDIPESERYDFDENPDPCELGKDLCTPLNPAPHKKKEVAKKCCCELVCTEIFLVNWNKKLH